MNILLGPWPRMPPLRKVHLPCPMPLDRDHDGSVLDDVMGMFTGQAKPASEKALNGEAILGHVLAIERTVLQNDLPGIRSGHQPGRFH